MTAESLADCSVCDCCGLNHDSTQVVVSRGNPSARLMLIGEAPGAREDVLAEPFVGRSGKVLDQLLVDVGINPCNDVYICNAVKCRPPNNRRPLKAELFFSYTQKYYYQLSDQAQLYYQILLALQQHQFFYYLF